MVMFNELLVASGIDPAQVALLRHSGRGLLGLTPHDLWERADGSFDLYQRTQKPDKPIFKKSSYWASFVSCPDKSTAFVGLYAAAPGDAALIDWECPINGGYPGEVKGRPSDLYDIRLLDALAPHRGTLTVDWGQGAIGWDRYAHRNELPIIGPVDLERVHAFTSSAEGDFVWQQQKKVERSPRIAETAIENNRRQHGTYVCQACDFQNDDRSLFDVHHPHPLLAGPRLTRVGDLIVLCPICHRRAHRSPNRMLPYPLDELRAWNAAGRPSDIS